jgi:hypothetical protein
MNCPICDSPNPSEKYFVKIQPNNIEEVFTTENSVACSDNFHADAALNPESKPTG